MFSHHHTCSKFKLQNWTLEYSKEYLYPNGNLENIPLIRQDLAKQYNTWTDETPTITKFQGKTWIDETPSVAWRWKSIKISDKPIKEWRRYLR